MGTNFLAWLFLVLFSLIIVWARSAVKKMRINRLRKIQEKLRYEVCPRCGSSDMIGGNIARERDSHGVSRLWSQLDSSNKR